jgi:hypothetical protein
VDEVGAALDHGEVEFDMHDACSLQPLDLGDVGERRHVADRDRPRDDISCDPADLETLCLESLRIARILDEDDHLGCGRISLGSQTETVARGARLEFAGTVLEEKFQLGVDLAHSSLR